MSTAIVSVAFDWYVKVMLYFTPYLFSNFSFTAARAASKSSLCSGEIVTTRLQLPSAFFMYSWASTRCSAKAVRTSSS